MSTNRIAPLVCVLDNVRSGHNVGAAFRIADGLAIDRLYLCGITPAPPHREIRKVALGAEETVLWHHTSTTRGSITELQAKGYQIISVEQTEGATPLYQLDTTLIKRPTALVFGHEVWGVDKAIITMSDSSIVIPQYGSKKSLNVSTCMAIVAWEWSKRGRIDG